MHEKKNQVRLRMIIGPSFLINAKGLPSYLHILLQKNNLKLGLEEQHAIDQISSPKRLLLDYYKKGKYIAVKYNVWKVEKNHISNEIMKILDRT